MQSDHAKESLVARLVGENAALGFARAWTTDCARFELYKARGWASSLGFASNEVAAADGFAKHIVTAPSVSGAFSAIAKFE